MARKRRSTRAKHWQRKHLIDKDGAYCKICKKIFESKKEITLDHIIPVSKGGDDEISNLQLAHFECNQTKNDMLPEEFELLQIGGRLF
jgi:5-methylcytosine-specific restriction endonuclease McrA